MGCDMMCNQQENKQLERCVPMSLMTIRPMDELEILIRLFSAALIGAIIGLEREYKNRPAGMRTHTLVCLGAAIVAMLEGLLMNNILTTMQNAEGVAISMGRMSAQVISGIGFLGAGTIMVSQKRIAGLTTAASVWTVACIGLLCGFGYYLFGLLTGAMVMGVLFLQRVIHVNHWRKVEIRFLHRTETIAYLQEYFGKKDIQVLDVDFTVETIEDENGKQNLYINIYTLQMPHGASYADVVNELSQYKNVRMVRTRAM